MAPCSGTSGDQRVRDQGQHRGGCQLGGPVDSAVTARAGDRPGQRQREHHEADGYVDQEDRPPSGRADHGATRDRTGRDGRAADRGPDRDRTSPGRRFAIELRDHCHRGGYGRRRGDPRDCPQQDQGPQPRGERAEQGCQREDGDPGPEEPLGTEPVRRRPRRQQQRGERHRVANNRPLQPGHRGVQRRRQIRLGDRQRCHVQQHHEVAQRDARQDAGTPSWRTEMRTRGCG